MRCSNSQCNKTLPTTIRYCPYCGTPTLGIGALQRVTGSLSRLSYLPVRKKVVLSVAALGVLVFLWSQFSPSVNMRINPKDNAEMIFIPPGEFIQGHDQWNESRPVRRVFLDGYWIYKYEVTVAQYRKFCQDTGRKMPDAPTWGWIDDHPIVNVTWEDADAYARWAGGRLPTEAQWEKAARGQHGRLFPWGDTWDVHKCVASDETTHRVSPLPVGSRHRGGSVYGVMDLAGNVWEWCSDYYDKNYLGSPNRNPRGPSYSSFKSLRGGSWMHINNHYLSSAFRYFGMPEESKTDIGFRVVKDTP